MTVYAELLTHEQRYLHDYFQPTKDLTDADLIEHRQRITKERPSPPHQAGRVLAKLDERAAVMALRKVWAAKHPRHLPALSARSTAASTTSR